VKIVYRDSFKDARPYEREFAGIRRFEPLSRANEGLVDILQVGRDDAEGWFYYVMELADHGEMQNARQAIPELPFRKMRGMRNIVAHDRVGRRDRPCGGSVRGAGEVLRVAATLLTTPAL
jgi:hypothetical protein